MEVYTLMRLVLRQQFFKEKSITEPNKAIALALAGAGFVSALTIAYPVWAQTGEDPIPCGGYDIDPTGGKLEAQYAVLAGSK